MNKTELGKLLEKLDLSDEEILNKDDIYFHDWLNGLSGIIKTSLGNLKLITLEDDSFHECEMRTIFQFEDKYYCIPWVYDSWDSHHFEFDKIYEVERKEVTKMEWVKI